MMSAAKQAPKRVYEGVADELARLINSEAIADGSVLPPERVLAERFGVSRTTIREALLSLQAAGLLSLSKRSRARVTRMTNPAFINQLSGAAQTLLAQPRGISDFQEARALFECGLARHAARHASPKDIERLGVALLRNKKAIGDAGLFAQTDLAYHDILAEIPRNPIFTALNKSLSNWLLDQRTTVVGGSVRGAARMAYRGHEEIYEAIVAHDPERADAAMADHLSKISDAFWKAKDAYPHAGFAEGESTAAECER